MEAWYTMCNVEPIMTRTSRFQPEAWSTEALSSPHAILTMPSSACMVQYAGKGIAKQNALQERQRK